MLLYSGESKFKDLRQLLFQFKTLVTQMIPSISRPLSPKLSSYNDLPCSSLLEKSKFLVILWIKLVLLLRLECRFYCIACLSTWCFRLLLRPYSVFLRLEHLSCFLAGLDWPHSGISLCILRKPQCQYLRFRCRIGRCVWSTGYRDVYLFVGLESRRKQDDVSICEPVGEVEFVVASEDDVEVETFDSDVGEVADKARVGSVIYFFAELLVLL